MKSPAAVICAAAWILAAVVQLVFTLRLPDTIVVFGVDVSHATALMHVKQAIYIACGVALAIAACLIRKWRFPLLIASSLFYLVHWLPWRRLSEFGLSATLKSMYLLGSIPGLRFTAAIRDVALPIAFVVVIVLAILERRRSSFG